MPCMPDFTTVRFIDEQVDTICAVNPSFKKCVLHEGRNKVLYVTLNTSLHGMFSVALLWHELHSTTLVKLGCKLNLHDLCVAKKMINNNQCAITRFVDDSKMSHVEEQVVRDVVKQIEKNYGSISAVHGQIKDFLVMNLEFLKMEIFE